MPTKVTTYDDWRREQAGTVVLQQTDWSIPPTEHELACGITAEQKREAGEAYARMKEREAAALTPQQEFELDQLRKEHARIKAKEEREAIAEYKRVKGRAIRDIDGRTIAARRFRAKYDELSLSMKSKELSEADRMMLRRAVTLSMWAEDMERRLVQGHDIEMKKYEASANTLRIILEKLGLL